MILQIIHIAKFAVFKTKDYPPSASYLDRMKPFQIFIERVAFPLRRQLFGRGRTIKTFQPGQDSIDVRCGNSFRDSRNIQSFQTFMFEVANHYYQYCSTVRTVHQARMAKVARISDKMSYNNLESTFGNGRFPEWDGGFLCF